LQGRCPQCQCDANMLPVPWAAGIAGVSSRTIYRWVEENRVHFSESRDGTVLICENSLHRT
jgi:predicted DNA-binding transcriptional regulator AlpA